MSRRLEHLERLQELCDGWGGSLALVSEFTYRKLFRLDEIERGGAGPEIDSWPFQEAPFADWAGMHWYAKFIVGAREHVHVNAIIHEMGHAFACTTDPNGLKWDGSYEWNFLGWEIAVAHQVGCYKEWSDLNASYGVDDGENWGNLDTGQRALVVEERLAAARAAGLLDAQDKPLAIR